jgi:hypothetical protein
MSQIKEIRIINADGKMPQIKEIRLNRSLS